MMNEQKTNYDTVLYFEEIAEGDEAEVRRVITEEDVVNFAKISGDTNPVHLDESYAATTLFGKRIAHGSLCSSYISSVFGTKLPGPGCIYVSQSLRFKAPVYFGDEVVAKVKVTGLVPKKHIAEFRTQCFVKDKLVLDGEAALMLPSRSKR